MKLPAPWAGSQTVRGRSPNLHQTTLLQVYYMKVKEWGVRRVESVSDTDDIAPTYHWKRNCITRGRQRATALAFYSRSTKFNVQIPLRKYDLVCCWFFFYLQNFILLRECCYKCLKYLCFFIHFILLLNVNKVPYWALTKHHGCFCHSIRRAS